MSTFSFSTSYLYSSGARNWWNITSLLGTYVHCQQQYRYVHTFPGFIPTLKPHSELSVVFTLMNLHLLKSFTLYLPSTMMNCVGVISAENGGNTVYWPTVLLQLYAAIQFLLTVYNRWKTVIFYIMNFCNSSGHLICWSRCNSMLE